MTAAICWHAAPRVRRGERGPIAGAIGVAFAAGSALWAPGAGAGTVTVLDTHYVATSQGLLTRDCFTLQAPGTATVKLTDLDWYQALASLSFKLTDAAGDSLGTMTGPGTSTFNLMSAGHYFVTMYAVGQVNPVPSLSFGSYGIDITVMTANTSTVPAPAAGLLLASGLALAEAYRRWSRRRGLLVLDGVGA